MAMFYSDLNETQQAHVERVTADLYANRDPAQVGVYGSDFATHGVCFAATRAGNSWELVMDWKTGQVYHTFVQLPESWYRREAA